MLVVLVVFGLDFAVSLYQLYHKYQHCTLAESGLPWLMTLPVCVVLKELLGRILMRLLMMNDGF